MSLRSGAPSLPQLLISGSADGGGMKGATLEELRELSLRSRRSHRAAVLTMLGLLVLVPLYVALAMWLPAAWTAYGVVGAGGAMLLNYAHTAGKERGTFRKVFARMREDRLRSVVVQEAEREITRADSGRA